MDPFINIMIGAVLGAVVSCACYAIYRGFVRLLASTPEPDEPEHLPHTDPDFDFDFDAEHDNLHRFRKRNERRTPLN